MSSLLRRLRKRLRPTPGIRIIGYGSPGVVKVELPQGGPLPGVYPAEALGFVLGGGNEPITHVEVLKRGVDHG